jgi:hypothetical protein
MEAKFKTKTNGARDLKNERDSPPRRSLREILQQGAGSSGVPVTGPVATSEPAAVTSAKGKDEPMVRNLPEVEPRNYLLGVRGIDTTIQGDGSAGIPAVGGHQGSLVPSIGKSDSGTTRDLSFGSQWYIHTNTGSRQHWHTCTMRRQGKPGPQYRHTCLRKNQGPLFWEPVV